MSSAGEMGTADYLRKNRDLWDRMTPIHARSDFYNLKGFKAGRCTLMKIDHREDHPMRSIFEDQDGVREPRVGFPYFHSECPIKFQIQGTYADPSADIRAESYEWFHSLSDVVNALISAGLRIEYLHEFPFSTYRSLPFLVQETDGLWRYPPYPESLPLTFAIRAVKAS